MKSTLVLLPDLATSNLVRGLAWSLHRDFGTSIDVCRLPPHISLRQPFVISDLKPMETYFRELAGRLTPFEVTLTSFGLVETTRADQSTGILWLDVEEHRRLRELHHTFCQNADALFGETSAPFDGPDYHFHMTVAIGGQPLEVYRKLFSSLAKENLPRTCAVRELALFVADPAPDGSWNYMLHQVLPLG